MRQNKTDDSHFGTTSVPCALQEIKMSQSLGAIKQLFIPLEVPGHQYRELKHCSFVFD
jgi:hypothetical protein